VIAEALARVRFLIKQANPEVADDTTFVRGFGLPEGSFGQLLFPYGSSPICRVEAYH
jgi:hypothetical protein